MVGLTPSISGEINLNSKTEKVDKLVFSTGAAVPFIFLSGMQRDGRVIHVSILLRKVQEYDVKSSFHGKWDADIDYMLKKMRI